MATSKIHQSPAVIGTTDSCIRSPDGHALVIGNDSSATVYDKSLPKYRIAKTQKTSWGTSIEITTSDNFLIGILIVGHWMCSVWCGATKDINITWHDSNGTHLYSSNTGEMDFGPSNDTTAYHAVRSGTTLTITTRDLSYNTFLWIGAS